MPTIYPKIFAKLDFFATVSHMGVAYFALKIFSQFLNILENWQKKYNFLRAKDNLKGRDFLAIIHQ